MSLINKFSVAYNIEQANKRRRQSMSVRYQMERRYTMARPEILTNEVAESLIKMGFDIEVLMILMKIHPYASVEEAMHLLGKDADTGKYNHSFYNNKPDIKGKTNYCFICNGTLDEHVDTKDYIEHKSKSAMQGIYQTNVKGNSCKAGGDNNNNNINSNSNNNNESFNYTKTNSKLITSMNNNTNCNNNNIRCISGNACNSNNNINNNIYNSNTTPYDISQTPLIGDSSSNIPSLFPPKTNNNTNTNNNIISNTSNNPNINNINNSSLNGLNALNNSNHSSNNHTPSQITQNTNRNSHLNNNQNLRNNVFSRIDINKIEIPQETLNMFDNPNTCRICFANTVNKSNPAQITCGHFFCDNCIQMHMTTKIVNGRVLDIRCLMGGCPKKYTDDEISANVNDIVFHKYKRFKNEQLKLNNPNKKYVPCPFPDCDELVEIENPDEEFVECGQRHVFCYKCHRLGTHKKGKCQRENIVLLNQIQKGNKNGINFKQCPKCKIIIEKNEGCNQMLCINCNYSFCWLCMKRYTDDHYALYNVRGCPGMRFENDSGSKWMRNPCLKVLWYLFSCVLGFFAVLLVLLFYLFFGCAYEFVNCYTKKKVHDEEEEDEELGGSAEDRRDGDDYGGGGGNEGNVGVNHANSGISRGIQGSGVNNSNYSEERVKKNKILICIVAVLGVICQPLYLMFYILYGLMECYRRFNCWFYYVDY